MIILKHLLTGSNVYIRSYKDVSAVFCAPKDNKGSDVPWVVIGVMQPIPIAMPLEEVLRLTEFTTTTGVPHENKEVG